MGLISFIKRLLGLEKRPIYKAKYGPLKFIFKKGYGLPYKTEKKSIIEYNKELQQFIKKHKRGPTRFELGKIIRNVLHIVKRYKRGNSGHWVRQRVRHYLFNLYGIRYRKR